MAVGQASRPVHKRMRCVFLGTPNFAVPTLEAIVSAGHDVISVVTQPDRPSGRGQQLTPSPVKEAALRHTLSVYQPERIRRPEAVATLAKLKPDVMVVVGYGQIIPQSIIDIPPRGIINVHASLLPKYRGAGPVQWAIANGETRTGVTTMRIDAGLDTGDMLLKAETAIGLEETAMELGARLALMGAALLSRNAGPHPRPSRPQKQDSAQATYAPLLKKEDGLIDWHQPAPGHPQSRARISAVARRLHPLSRPAIAHLEIACGRWAAGGGPTGKSAAPSAARGLRRGCAGTDRSATRRPQANLRRSLRQRPAHRRRRHSGRIIEVDLPLGYRYAATYAGIRQAEKDDLGLIVSGLPAAAAGVFYAESRAGRAREAVPPSSGRLARRGRRHPGECRQRQLRHAHGRRGGAGLLPVRRAPVAAAGDSGAARFDRRDRRRTVLPFTAVPACNLPVYASQWPLPVTTQDLVRGCELGFAAVSISGN